MDDNKKIRGYVYFAAIIAEAQKLSIELLNSKSSDQTIATVLYAHVFDALSNEATETVFIAAANLMPIIKPNNAGSLLDNIVEMLSVMITNDILKLTGIAYSLHEEPICANKKLKVVTRSDPVTDNSAQLIELPNFDEYHFDNLSSEVV